MAYKISIRPSATKDLDILPDKEVQNILHRIEQLKENQQPIGVQKLNNQEGYRVCSGNYRIIFEINDKLKIILIYRIKHRKDVYRK